MSAATPRGAGRGIRIATLALLFALIAVVWLWQLTSIGTATVSRVALAIVLTIPLWLPVRGLLHGTRRTYAWATLCVIPYFVLGITEAIANPNGRMWASLCLLLAFLLFVALIAYLRVTRVIRGASTSPPRS